MVKEREERDRSLKEKSEVRREILEQRGSVGVKNLRRQRGEDFQEGKERGRECEAEREEGRKLKEEKLEVVRNVLFGAMVMEKILSLPPEYQLYLPSD